MRLLLRRLQPPRPHPDPDGSSPALTSTIHLIARRRPRHATTDKRGRSASPVNRLRRQTPRSLRPQPTWKKRPRHRSEPRAQLRAKSPASNKLLPSNLRRHRHPRRCQRPSQHNPRSSQQNKRNVRSTESTSPLVVSDRSPSIPRHQHRRSTTKPRRPNTPRNLRRLERPATFHSSERGTP